MKCLLLNSTYDSMAFIAEVRALKLYFNDKVEIISSWDEKIHWASGSMKIPAIVRLKYYVKFVPHIVPFNRLGVFRRDQFTCQYCSRALNQDLLTIDHILPKSRGGLTSWKNTISSCVPCNLAKSNKTPEEAGMQLINRPFVPEFKLRAFLPSQGTIHPDWSIYLK